jgi:hypothetical protein
MTEQRTKKPSRYGENRYRYQGGTLAMMQQTHVYVPGDKEDPVQFANRVLDACTDLDAKKHPTECIDLVQVIVADKVTKATIVVQPDEPTMSSLLHSLERILHLIRRLVTRHTA